MSTNTNLHTARQAQKDEFYTQLTDIEKELKYYRNHFKNKVVLCNCDDPYESNFFKYFALNFNSLGLKKLITTCYKGSPVVATEMKFTENNDFVFDNKSNIKQIKPFKLEITEVKDYNGDKRIDLSDVEWLIQNNKNVKVNLKGDGDFRSQECIEILKEADIIVTNPPFSLFREYLAQLTEYKKQFLIIGNLNAVTYKEVFPLIKANKVWLGTRCGHTLFKVPDTYNIPEFYDLKDKSKLRSNGYIVDENGKLWRNLGNICWFTNLDINKRHKPIDLFKKYNPKVYPKYDNYEIININKYLDIPCNYTGIMGVPISFLHHHCPEQFEILGIANSARWIGYECYTTINNKRIYNRILLRYTKSWIKKNLEDFKE